MNPALWAPSAPNRAFPCQVRTFVAGTNCSRRLPVRRASARLKCRIHSVLEDTHSRAQHAAPLPTNESGIARTICKAATAPLPSVKICVDLCPISTSNSPRAEQLRRPQRSPLLAGRNGFEHVSPGRANSSPYKKLPWLACPAMKTFKGSISTRFSIVHGAAQPVGAPLPSPIGWEREEGQGAAGGRGDRRGHRKTASSHYFCALPIHSALWRNPLKAAATSRFPALSPACRSPEPRPCRPEPAPGSWKSSAPPASHAPAPAR